jgi:hypothetical protein
LLSLDYIGQVQEEYLKGFLSCACCDLKWKFDRFRFYAAEKEFRELTREEEELLRLAESQSDGTLVSNHREELVHSLYCRQLVYIDIPVSPEQRFSTSSLDGFVSNRDLVAGDSDPMEALLYEIFVSNSERLRLVELADVLEKDLKVIMQVMSIAVRMGFAVLIDGMLCFTRATFLDVLHVGVSDEHCSKALSSAAAVLRIS